MDRYCKVEKGSSLYDNLIALYTKMVECKKSAEKLALKYSNNSGWYRNRNPFVYSGGVDAFIFKVIPDAKVWKKVYSDGYQPKANSKIGKQILAEMKLLPIVDCDELQEAFSAKNISGRSYIFGCGFYAKDDVCYFSYSSDIWEINDPNIIEITQSEYNK